jgi:hypothetical protein
MTTVHEPAACLAQALPQLREQLGQPGGIQRKFGPVETWRIHHHPASPCQGVEGHMAGGVTPTPQPTGNGGDPQRETGTERIQQAALAHA